MLEATLAAQDAGAGPIVGGMLIGMLIAGAIGRAIGSSKGHGGTGFLLGALLGIIGWIIVAVMKPAAAHAYAAVPSGPPCTGCGTPARWIPEQNGWGCDRCRHMLAVPRYAAHGR